MEPFSLTPLPGEGKTEPCSRAPELSTAVRFANNIDIRNSRRQGVSFKSENLEGIQNPYDELQKLVRQCNETKVRLPDHLIALYTRIREVSKCLLVYTPPQRYAPRCIDDVIANDYLKHVNVRLPLPLNWSSWAERVALMGSMTYFFSSRVFIDETSQNNELTKYTVSLIEQHTDTNPATKSILLEICCSVVAGFVARAEPTATYANVVDDAMLCLHNNSLLKPALRYAFQVLHGDGNIDVNLVFIDHLFDAASTVWSLIEDNDGILRDGYKRVFEGIMTAGSLGKHSSLLIAQYREFQTYGSWEFGGFQTSDCYEDIFHTRPLAKHICYVCHKDRCRVDDCLDKDPLWMQCSRCTNRYLCSSQCRLTHRQRVSCTSLVDSSDVMYRAIQFWFKTNACRFLHDISDACNENFTSRPGDLVLLVDFFPEIVGLRIIKWASQTPGINPFPFRYSEAKQRQATAELTKAYWKYFPPHYNCLDILKDPSQKHNGILMFANYLDYSDPRGYVIFRLDMPHDTSGVNCISEDFISAATHESDSRLVRFVSRNIAEKIRREFGVENIRKKTRVPARALSTRVCQYQVV